MEKVIWKLQFQTETSMKNDNILEKKVFQLASYKPKFYNSKTFYVLTETINNPIYWKSKSKRLSKAQITIVVPENLPSWHLDLTL